jgi:phytoene/squalene synthetase
LTFGCHHHQIIYVAQALEFQQTHLDRVSRSFAFCIRRLPQPLGRWVGLTYLICRILDTIEDAKWKAPVDQKAAFDSFDAAIREASACSLIQNWHTMFHDVSAGEELLLRDAHLVLRDLHELPEPVQSSIRDLVLSMSSGMQHFARLHIGGLRLRSLAEVNQYCFFVAGLVGEALTQLVSSVEPAFPLNMPSVLRAHHFGLFLQKVNILKDQMGDEESGRWLVPSRDQLEASAKSNAQQALDFLCSIPTEQVEFRQFCGWSLFLGLETLVVARASFWKKALIKISRDHTKKLLAHVDAIVIDNEKLRAFFYAQSQQLGWDYSVAAPQPVTPSPEWLADIYRGQLDRQSLLRLGVGG